MNQQTPIDSKNTIEWLNKLIMLAQYDKKLAFHTVQLLKDQTEYQAFLTRVRASVTDQTQLTDSSTEDTPVVVARKKLFAAVAAVPALCELFGSSQDPFNNASPDQLELLAEVSDVTADSQKMVFSRNGTLESVIAALPLPGEFDPDSLIVEDLNKFLTLWATEPAAENEKSPAELLYELATSSHWYLVMASLRASRDYTRDEEPAVKDTLERWKKIIAKQTLKKLLSVHLSRAPKKLIRLAWEQRELFVEAGAKRPENIREKDPDDERKQVAKSASLLFEERFKPQIDEIRNDLRLLAVVGSHFINVRKFAKLDGFVYTWPEIARLGMANYKALKHVEDLFLNRMPRPADADLEAREARELYSLVEKNDRLKRFMCLRPHFSQIDENELMHYRPLAPVVVTTGRPGTEVRESVNVTAPQQPPAPAPQPKVLQVQTLTIEQAQDAPPSEKGVTYELDFSMLGKTVTGPVTFGVEQLLKRVLAAMGVASDSELHDTLKELFVSDARSAEERIRRGGAELASNVLQYSVELLPQGLATPSSLRLVVNSSERGIHYLPWEWWPTSTATLALSSPDHSVVRSFKPPTEDLPKPILAPLRLLSVIPNAPQGRRFTSDITLKALHEVSSVPTAQYRALVRDEAIMEKISLELESFKPHVVHLETYVHAKSGGPDYGLSMSVSGDSNDEVFLDYFGTALKAAGVQLLVIGRNDVSRLYENPIATAAFQLAKKGLAVIAPLRAIDDAAATTFTTEFYRAFLQGNKLESALHLARRNLASKGGDWSVFALFADPDHFQYLELLRWTA